MTISLTFRNTNIRAVYLISYIQRGNGTDTAFHRTYSCSSTKIKNFLQGPQLYRGNGHFCKHTSEMQTKSTLLVVLAQQNKIIAKYIGVALIWYMEAKTFDRCILHKFKFKDFQGPLTPISRFILGSEPYFRPLKMTEIFPDLSTIFQKASEPCSMHTRYCSW